MITILFNFTAKDYEAHFDQIFSCLEFESWDTFEENFAGNTSDFEGAIKVGFFSSVKKYATMNSFQLEVSDDKIMSFYRFCLVHFQRTKTRVCRNGKIIPGEKVDLFHKSMKELYEIQPGMFYLFRRKCIQFFKDFPNAENWLKWHLQPDRAR